MRKPPQLCVQVCAVKRKKKGGRSHIGRRGFSLLRVRVKNTLLCGVSIDCIVLLLSYTCVCDGPMGGVLIRRRRSVKEDLDGERKIGFYYIVIFNFVSYTSRDVRVQPRFRVSFSKVFFVFIFWISPRKMISKFWKGERN